MTVLHIGLFKTGTTSIQRYLRDHPQVLDSAGYRFPYGWLRRDCHLEPHFVFMRLDRDSSAREQGVEWLDPDWRADVYDQLAVDLARGGGEPIWSSEHLSLLRFDDEIAPLADLVGRTSRVILYLRNQADWLRSMRDQLVKNGIQPSQDPESHAYVEADSWRVDYRALIDAWSVHFQRLTVVDYDAAVETYGSVIPSFLNLLGVTHTRDEYDYWLNARGHVDPRIPGVRTDGLRFGEVPAAAPAPLP